MLISILLLLAHLVSLPGADGQQSASSSERDLVYLVYAGPFASSPASTFGHLYLAFADSSDHAPALWDVYTFNAETNNAGTFKYVATGVSGGFLGRFEHTKYLTKVQDYVIDEDRDLWIFKLLLSPHQVTGLKEALAQTEGNWYPYTFFQKNCAYYIQGLLHLATETVPAPNGITSPSSVVREVISKDLVQQSYFKPRMSVSLRTEANSLSADFEKVLKKRNWQEALSEVISEDDLTVEQLRFSLLYFWWAQREVESHLPANVEALLEELRLKGTTARVDGDSENDWIGSPTSPGFFHPYSRVESKLGTQFESSLFFSLKIRAGAYDHLDVGPTTAPLNQLEILSADLLFDIEEQTAYLDHITLLSQVALVPYDWLKRERSWKLELAGQRGGVQGDRVFHSFAKYGSGLTKKAGQNLYLYALLEVGANYANQHKVLPTGGFDSGLLWNPLESIRLGGSFSYESSWVNADHNFRSGEFWLGANIRESLLLDLRVISNSAYTRLSVGISHYL